MEKGQYLDKKDPKITAADLRSIFGMNSMAASRLIRKTMEGLGKPDGGFVTHSEFIAYHKYEPKLGKIQGDTAGRNEAQEERLLKLIDQTDKMSIELSLRKGDSYEVTYLLGAVKTMMAGVFDGFGSEQSDSQTMLTAMFRVPDSGQTEVGKTVFLRLSDGKLAETDASDENGVMVRLTLPVKRIGVPVINILSARLA